MKSEGWKIAVVVVLLVVALGVYWKFGCSREPLSPSVDFVCVATGKIYAIKRDDMPSMLPAKNPDTGEYTLLPVIEMDGKTIVSPHHATALRDPERLGKVNKYVDPQTLEVLKSPRP